MISSPPKLGCLESPIGYPRVFLSKFMASNLPPPPPTADFHSKVARFPMMLNDTYGDCVIAGQGHHIQIATAYGLGAEKIITDAQVKQTYFTQTGGRDSGLNIPESLDWWVKNSVAGYKLSAWASVNAKSTEEIQHAIAGFGSCYFGVSLPNHYIDAINQKVPWTSLAYPANPQNGHCVLAAGYDKDFVYLLTWGQIQKASWQWIEKYADEADILLSPEWQSSVITPGSIDLDSLYKEFESLTGKKPPIPGQVPEIPWDL